MIFRLKIQIPGETHQHKLKLLQNYEYFPKSNDFLLKILIILNQICT